MRAKSKTDMEKHQVLVEHMVIDQVHFPGVSPDSARDLEKTARSFLSPDRTVVLSVEQVVACIEPEEQPKTIALRNDPPVIFVAQKPTILLQLEGGAVEAPVGKDSLYYVFNANYPLFSDHRNKKLYLYDGLSWRTSAKPEGPWSYTGSLPASLSALPKDSNWSHMTALFPPPAKPSVMPDVFFSAKPAELVVIKGTPSMSAIEGTTLRYVRNTDADLLYSKDKVYYLLSAGRWFSASSLDGPWTFASDKLPEDFRKIPLTSSLSRLLKYVPGTDEAKDAALIARIPTTVTVDVKAAEQKVSVQYAGEPKFTKIDSTDNLYYAVNAEEKVIRINNSGPYYACVQGIWFTSTAANGPWTVATSIPQVIYTIPPASPVYNVTYVTQVVNTNGTVQSSYTSGYMGVFVVGFTAGIVIASGTGYYHPPYYYYPPFGYPYCYHYPYTYGVYAYHPYPYGGMAYKAAYNPYTGTYARSATAFGPYGSYTRAQAYNPYTGTYARGASVATPYGRQSVAQAYNPYTGNAAATRQGSSPYGQWGTSVAGNGSGQWVQTGHAVNSQGGVAGARTSSGGAIVTGSGQQGSGTVARNAQGDMVAAKNGNVYKNTGDGWQHYDNGNWNSVNKPAPQSQGGQRSNAATQGNWQQQSASMNREMQNRQRGNMQTQQFQQSGGMRAGGGGMRGGGRRR
jgi:hypothetical protein